MQSVTGEVEASIRYLVTLAKVYVIIGLRLFFVLGISIIRLIRYRLYHHVFRIIGSAGPVAA